MYDIALMMSKKFTGCMKETDKFQTIQTFKNHN